MKYYIATINNKMVAFHHKRKIVERFMELYLASNQLSTGVILKTDKENQFIKDKENLLVQAGNIYVPAKYEVAYLYGYANNEVSGMITEVENLLMKPSVTKKEKSYLHGALFMLYSAYDADISIPSIENLEEIRNNINEWRYSSGFLY
jgi:hypothetical protein